MIFTESLLTFLKKIFYVHAFINYDCCALVIRPASIISFCYLRAELHFNLSYIIWMKKEKTSEKKKKNDNDNSTQVQRLTKDKAILKNSNLL